MATELQYPERSVFLKKVISKNPWTFELGTQEGIIIATWIYVVFLQNEMLHSQSFNNDTFVRLLVVSAQVINGTEKYPDSGALLNYHDDDYAQGYGQNKEVFKARTKHNILQPYISEDDFRSCNDDNDIGYNIYAFDKRYQKKFESSQPV